jgi:hypothetical protein
MVPLSITMPAPESLIEIEPHIGRIAHLDNLADVASGLRMVSSLLKS